jgi:hypothetical protein
VNGQTISAETMPLPAANLLVVARQCSSPSSHKQSWIQTRRHVCPVGMSRYYEGARGVDYLPHVTHLFVNHGCRDFACLCAAGKPVIFDVDFVSLSPPLLSLPGEPFRGHDGQRVHSRSKGIPFRAIEGAKRGQHGGRVTALAPTCFDSALFPLLCE